jgi:hypothetical protein
MLGVNLSFVRRKIAIDVLAIDDNILYKKKQPEYKDKGNWQDEFELD